MPSILHKAKVLLWGETPKDPKEARLLLKMDWFILSFACLLYWVNYLDRLNLSNAYVSGMKEEIGLVGNQFNVINTMFTVGYVVGLIPHNLILLRVRPSIWLSVCGFCWGVLVLGMYKVEHFYQLCVIRFFQAFFESSTFTGVHLILSQWYKEEELTKRTAVFTSSGLIGNIFSSTMQASIHTTLNGRNGLSGWRWLFIIDFIITVPIVTYGFFFFPDTPATAKAIYFTEEELEIARRRMPPAKTDVFNWSIVRRVVGSWKWYLFSLLFVFAGENESYSTNSLFSLYLTYFGYSVDARNHYPMGMYAMGVFFTFGFALYVDGTGARYHWHVAVATAVIMIISTIMMLAAPDKSSVMFAAHYLSGCSYAGQASYFAWANVVCANDLQERAVVLASMNMFSNAVNAWWSILFYSADTAPHFTKGCYAMIATVVASVVVAGLIRVFQLRDERIERSPADDEKSEHSIGKDGVVTQAQEVESGSVEESK
ncbi:hypothetical protein PSN45_004389 [Yamadazyma tenuis]|uniref:MFS general substrate transporter n=1 Tax=Candida tenuis (strain ATCC 10573 / BCRC 21748 / CBS 615 / JCM 9827 / NBRC 10315 / NRRL Y-1498 / VKM Y-70) TaxID=590646 RepID=G3B5Y7_CANTC|nr:uncharacterized protein CANTEDRAFT_107114 [Yamadazyma tenuis ATCC 10573]EGV63333.1 hypothetical protein CANTEDRAFT_107114 [Yamadazyma tenuis ATCC 10573]WEJ96845.1 hypothetical protein PSN45_004389 [Yamadazyma tenuis]